MADGILVKDLNAWFGDAHILHDIGLAVAPKAVTALIGPSGCGKSTFIRCLNRMHEVVPGARMEGEVLLDGVDIATADPVLLRRRVGMVFQKAQPFPSMSIFDNVAVGLRLNGMGVRKGESMESAVQDSLQKAALWDEVK